MLFVTFHGGKGGINNIYAYQTPDGQLASEAVLGEPAGIELSELRSMVLSNNFLFVANGGKSTSNVLCYKAASAGSICYLYQSTVVAANLNKSSQFTTSIAHPYGIAFVGDSTCFVSNQDTNVVALVTINDQQVGSLGSGCQSPFLRKQFPGAAFLDGTWAASQNGSLPNVALQAQSVPSQNGGLGVSIQGSGSSAKVQNSVRDVLAMGGTTFVCDEVHQTVNMYSLQDGSFTGSGTLSHKPTHMAANDGLLYVSAGSNLYTSSLPSMSEPGLSFESVKIDNVPSNDSVGGIAFDGQGNVYVAFQGGKGGANGGSIMKFTVGKDSSGKHVKLTNGSVLVESGPATFHDTPEFLLYLSE